MESERKTIGLCGCIALVLGNLLGAGVFTSPAEIIRGTSSIGMAVCIWIATGLLQLTGGFTFAEITSIIPISGFGASFMKFSGYRSVAFMFASSQIFLIFPSVITLQALTFSKYFMEACGIIVKDPRTSFYVNSSIAICVLLLLLLLNSFVKFTTVMRLNMFMTVFKVAVILFVFILACVVGKQENLANPFQNATFNASRIIIPSYSAFSAFNGYELICIGVEEVINPGRNLALAITSSLLITNIMYIFMNLAFCLVLGPQKLFQMSSAESLNYFCQVTLGKASFVIPLLIALTMINSLNCTIFGGSRIIHVSSREELLPAWLSCWSSNLKAPRVAFFFLITMAIIILLFLNLTTLSNINSFQDLTKLVQAATVTCLLLYIRMFRPKAKKDMFRVPPFFHFIFLVCIIACIVYVLATVWTQILLMVGFFGLALSIYMVMVRPTGIRRFEDVECFIDSMGVTFTRATERLFFSTADRQPAKPQTLFKKKLEN